MGIDKVLKERRVRKSVKAVINLKHNGMNDFCNLVKYQLGKENLKLQDSHKEIEKQSKLN